MEKLATHELSQTQKDKYCMIPIIPEMPGIGKSIETESRD